MDITLTKDQLAGLGNIARFGGKCIGKSVPVTVAHHLVKMGLVARGQGDNHTGYWSQVAVTEAAHTFLHPDPLEKILRMGAEAMAHTYRKVWTTDGGVPYLKRQKQQALEKAVADTYVAVLEYAYVAGTRAACRLRLLDKAAELGLLKKDGVWYALAVPEETLYGDLNKIPLAH